MLGRQNTDSRSRDTDVVSDDSSTRSSHATAFESGSHHPSRAFRRILRRAGAVGPERRPTPMTNSQAGRAPDCATLIAAAIVVGVVSGFLELGVLMVQVRSLHLVDWSTLMISRHAAWMVPVAGTAVTLFLTLALVTPALAWSAWRRHTRADDAPGWVWSWAGLVLGTLLLLGPLLAIRGLHVAAPVAIAIGLGFRLGRYIVRPTLTWRRNVYRAAVIAIGLLALAWVSQGEAGASISGRLGAKPDAHAPNLLWIVLDTLRADRMSVYGYPRPTTPQLEVWTKAGITFDMARSAAPWTLPSHVSMFTGLLPSEHGACIDRPYFGPSPTLAEHLRAHGYATAGIVANVRMCNSAYGVGRGFDHYVDYPWKDEISFKAAMSQSSLGTAVMEVARRMLLPVPYVYPFLYRQPARKIADEGRRWLDEVQRKKRPSLSGSDRPFFLFLNFMDVHGPYLPPADAPRRFWKGPAPSKKDARPEDGWLAVHARDAADAEHRPARERELNAVKGRLGDLYDECLAGLDAELGRFLGDLRDRGLLADTWLVITADHGEHFGEHGHFGHGSSLYNELTHVPLILIPPLASGRSADDPYGSLRGRRIGVPVSLRDLPGTMTGLLLPGVHDPFPGRSLTRYWRTDRTEPPDPVLSELEEPRLKGEDFRTHEVNRIESVIDEDHILIEYCDHTPELFELFEDPRQEHNLADRPDQGPRRQRMKGVWDALRERGGGTSR